MSEGDERRGEGESEERDSKYRREHPGALPRLNEQQRALVEEYGRPRRFAAGGHLIRAGDTEFRFQFLVSGRVEIVDRSSGSPRVLLVHVPGEFLGDLANLAGRASNVDAVAVSDVVVHELSLRELQQLIGERSQLSDLILRAFIARSEALAGRPDFMGIRVIGSQFSPDTFRIRDFLARNSVLYTWINVEIDDEVGALLERLQVRPEETPVVSYADDWVLRNPSNGELARRLGLRRVVADSELYDLAIVGGGPAGLAAAVYSASEGLKTIVLECHSPGGQAAGSARIENYLGFPMGITGAELTSRAVLQVQKFGASLEAPAHVTGLRFEGRFPVVELAGGETITAKALLIASGANYRKLEVPGRERFDSTGVYYAATPVEAEMCAGGQVAVVGAGNSAGQGAIFLAERVELTNNVTGEKRDLSVSGVFSFIGAEPCTDWLPDEIETDRRGFVLTGQQVGQGRSRDGHRPPFLLETSQPGVFAAGDVRSASVKRVASAVGEGAMAVQFVHEYFREL